MCLVAFKGNYYVNLALFRPAVQSSSHSALYMYIASYAVDGNAVHEASRAITLNNDLKPWWKVHLANPTWVAQVEIIGMKGEYTGFMPMV